MSLQCVFAIFVCAAAGAVPPPGAEIGRDVDEAIDAGIQYLLKEVEGPRGWTPAEKFPAGYAGVQVYALVKSDVSFQHPVVQKGLAIVEGAPFEHVYSVALDLMAHGAILEQIEADAKLGSARPAAERAQILERMQNALTWLMAARLRGVGAWDYSPLVPKDDPRTHRFDHSNTQFAVLALGVAAAHKLKVPPELWEEVADHFVQTQEKTGPEAASRPAFRSAPEAGKLAASPKKTSTQKDVQLYGGESVKVQARGWKYTREEFDAPKFAMACAGLSSLLLAQKNLGPQASGARGEAIRRAVRDGYGWLTTFFDSMKTPFPKMFGLHYDLYSLEKVGDIGEVASFGSFHWYEEGARKLIVTQKSDGSWGAGPGAEVAQSRSNTALALLFLSRATDLAGRTRPLGRATRGGGKAPAAPDRTAWIYLPSQKEEVPLVRLFRLFRYRPSKQVMKMMEEAVKVFDPQRLHELVRGLSTAASDSPFAAVQALARKLLVQATGVESKDQGEYRAWAERHEEVVRLGTAADKAGAVQLREWLSTSQGTPLKAKVIWALERTSGRAAVPDLIDLLEDADPALRESAHGALTFLTGQSLPFNARGGEKARVEQVRAWREWQRREALKGGNDVGK